MVNHQFRQVCTMWRSIFAVGLCIMAFNAFAHSGRTNAQGCHNDRKNGGYHCHNGGARSQTSIAPSKSIPEPHTLDVSGQSTSTHEDFYTCVQEVQRLAQTYSATLLSNTPEQYRVVLEMEDGHHIVTCLATHQKRVEYSK